MIDEMLTFLARAPTLGDLSLTWGQAGPRLGTGGVYLRGVKVLQTKTDLLGCQKQRCRAEFLLRLCLPLPAGDTDTALQNARRLAALQLDRTDPGGTALYSIRVMAEYTMRYDA